MGEEVKAEAKTKKKKAKISQDVVKAVNIASLITGLPEDQLLRNALSAYVDNMFIMEHLGNMSAVQTLAAAKFAYNIYETFARMAAQEMELRMMALGYYTKLFEIISDVNRKIEEIKTGRPVEMQEQQQQQQSQIEFLAQKIFELEKMLEQKVEELKSVKKEEEIERELSLSDFIDVDTIKDVVRPVITNVIANITKYGAYKLQSILK